MTFGCGGLAVSGIFVVVKILIQLATGIPVVHPQREPLVDKW